MKKRNNGWLKKASLILGIIIAVCVLVRTLLAPIISFGIDQHETKITIEKVKEIEPKVLANERSTELIKKDVEILKEDTKELKEGQKEIIKKLDRALRR